MAKFLSPSAFDADGDYQLLPFNFTQLDGERYVVTNMAGEYVTLERQDLNVKAGGEAFKFVLKRSEAGQLMAYHSSHASHASHSSHSSHSSSSY